MTEHRDYIDGYAAGLEDGRRIAPQPSSDAIREHLEGVARRSCTDEQFNAFKWIIDATFESLDLLHATQQATPEPLTGCNCRWQGDTQVEWCELHLAHKDAIHEWAQRAKAAEHRDGRLSALEDVAVLRGERGVLVRLLVEADKVLSTLEGESTDEQAMLEGLRRQILAATAQHRPQEADLLSVRAGLEA